MSELLSKHPSDLADEELAVAPALSARKQYEDFRATRGLHLTIVPTYQTWLKNQLWHEQQELKDLHRRVHELADDLWQLVYPDKTDWEHFGMIYNHVRLYIDECRRGEHPASPANEGAPADTAATPAGGE